MYEAWLAWTSAALAISATRAGFTHTTPHLYSTVSPLVRMNNIFEATLAAAHLILNHRRCPPASAIVVERQSHPQSNVWHVKKRGIAAKTVNGLTGFAISSTVIPPDPSRPPITLHSPSGEISFQSILKHAKIMGLQSRPTRNIRVCF